jgi:type I restriction enzyme S subunit
MTVLDRPAAMVVVHNPRATHPLPLGLLPAQEEFSAAVMDDEHYQLERLQGISGQSQDSCVTIDE